MVSTTACLCTSPTCRTLVLLNIATMLKDCADCNRRGTDKGDKGFTRFLVESGTNFLYQGAMGLKYRPSTRHRRALTQASNPSVQLLRGACQTYVTDTNDTIASVAYEHGVTPVGVLFENRPVLEDSGWLLGQDLPVGMTLSICNNRE